VPDVVFHVPETALADAVDAAGAEVAEVDKVAEVDGGTVVEVGVKSVEVTDSGGGAAE
jgi:hypothetical protein